MTSRKVMGGRGNDAATRASKSSSNLPQISVNALSMALFVPITVTMRSGHEPSVMLIFAPLSSRNRFTMSPFLPIMLPTSSGSP